MSCTTLRLWELLWWPQWELGQTWAGQQTYPFSDSHIQQDTQEKDIRPEPPGAISLALLVKLCSVSAGSP